MDIIRKKNFNNWYTKSYKINLQTIPRYGKIKCYWTR